MSQKKINRYVIFMKDILGKGSYGSVAYPLSRYIGANRKTPNYKSQSKCYRKN